MTGITRREFLRGTTATVAGLSLSSCFGGSPRTRSFQDAIPLDTFWPIKRVIYVMMENRSFDHMFGRFPGANGTTVGVADGREIPLAHAAQWTLHDLPHDEQAFLREVNGGRMDRFIDTSIQEVFAYTQFHEEDIPNYFAWAKNFVLCDNVFASAIGNSYSQHLYMIAGQSDGAWDAPVQSRAVRRVRERKGLAKTWGCDAPEGAYLWVADRPPRLRERPEDFAKRASPCHNFQTQGDQLTEAGVDWAYYSAADYQVGYIWNAYAAVDHIRNTDQWDKHIQPVDRLIDDIYDENLPAVTWVTPRYELSDHPPWSTCYGHNWITAIVNGVMRTSMWNSTAIFITWDEWGGFYDHVPPPQVDQWGLGIRVPMLIISPFAQRGLVDHEQGEFCSPQKFIADNWGLSYLTDRVKKTTNFEHVFDFKARPRGPDPRDPNRHCRGTRFKAKYDIEDWKRLPGFGNIDLSKIP